MKFQLKRKSMKILFVGAEAAPFVKVGGLGEVLRALPKELRELDVDARVFVPKYNSITNKEFPAKMVVEHLRVAPKEDDPHGLLISNVLQYVDADGGVTYFFENLECFEKRANVYGYEDDTMRWVLLSRGVLEFVKRSKWKPDFIISNDWQTGFVPNLMKTAYKDDPDITPIKSLFCIHNLRYQGMFDPTFMSEMDTDFGRKEIPPFFSNMKNLNGMRRGILYADQIVTVSPTYAEEIISEEYGEGLDGVLQERRGSLSGILNGIDTERFDPMTDPFIPVHYNVHHANRRIGNKAALERRFGIASKGDEMIAAYNGRLAEQKGIALLEKVLQPLLDNLPLRFVAVGGGDTRYKLFLKKLADNNPGRVGVHLEYDEKLPRLVYAGADVVLVPSRFEPAGLVPLEAMRYGAVPIARKTGGLADTVIDFDPLHEKGTGFVFDKFDPQALLITMVRAYESSRNKHEWGRLVVRAMEQDFSWKNSARKYLALCRRLAGQDAAAKATGS